jgi:hypothetical protein
MADFFIKTSDTAPSIAATLTDYAGTAVSLSGATVHVILRPFDGETSLYAEANNDDTGGATVGHVSYDWETEDLDTAGPYYGEWQVTFADASVETFPNDGYFTVAIIDDLGEVES